MDFYFPIIRRTALQRVIVFASITIMSKESGTTWEQGSSPLTVLFAASEAQPLIKTGGLADVAGSLPAALRELGHDVRLILPAYPQAVEKAIPLTTGSTLDLPGCAEPVRLLVGMLPGSDLPLYLVDAPGFFDRPGDPYTDHEGADWRDNPERFSLFCRAVAQVSLNQVGLGWQPDLVHCNDWQTALVPALLSLEWNRPVTLFTIHNLAYQGLFEQSAFSRLQLPQRLWSSQGLEFHQRLSFIKGGIAFADYITTVSPTYAAEVLRPELGYGLQGLLSHRSDRFRGVLNGIDRQIWDPASDPALMQNYDGNSFELKRRNKPAVQRDFGLPEDENAILFGHIGRLVEQKGIKLLLEVIPALMAQPRVQLVMLGHGDPEIERALQRTAAGYTDRFAVNISYDETLAHRVQGGCDSFLMPSLFEPCGLNQLYSMRYGTVPIVRRTGGLADTVVDANAQTLLDGTATGFVFEEPNGRALLEAVQRLIDFQQRPGIWWEKLANTGMSQDFGWGASALLYNELYHQTVNDPAPSPLA